MALHHQKLQETLALPEEKQPPVGEVERASALSLPDGLHAFGFSQPAVQRVLELLPGVEACRRYRCRFPIPPVARPVVLPVNPAGAARCEAHDRQAVRRLARSSLPRAAREEDDDSKGDEAKVRCAETPSVVPPSNRHLLCFNMAGCCRCPRCPRTWTIRCASACPSKC
jgi:hypothetical protein